MKTDTVEPLKKLEQRDSVDHTEDEEEEEELIVGQVDAEEFKLGKII